MENMDLLAVSLRYIEEHLGDSLRTDEIAAACACSRSTLEKLFRYVYHLPVHDYVIRRRMMRAAVLLTDGTERTLLDVAMECGYSTNESFTRAFRSVWNRNPSELRGSALPELFPRLSIPIEKGDAYIMTRKSFDITELYDLFRAREGCWFVCCDVKHLIPINQISLKAGDLAILTAMQRMQEAAGEDDVVFRIGGDEFCMLTASTEESYAETVMHALLSRNGEPIDFQGQKIPLSLHISHTRVPLHTPKYDELFTALHKAVLEGKD